MRRKGSFYLFGSILLIFTFCPVNVSEALEGLQVGMKAPPITLSSLEGNQISFTSFPKARFFVVVFWSTWSENSAAELERLEKLYQQYKDNGLVVFGVNVESQNFSAEELVAIREMVQSLGLTFPVLLDQELETFHRYGVIAIPSTVVLDKELVIKGEMSAYPIVGREELFELIEALILGREIRRVVQKVGYEPAPRAVRYYNLARVMRNQGTFDQLDLTLQKAIESDPKFILPLILMGKVYRERALFEESIEYKGKTYTTATFSQEKERNLREAMTFFKKALAIDPKHPSALTELASVLLLQGQINEAEVLLKNALEADSAYTPAHSLFGALFYKKGDHLRGEQAFETAQKLNPLDPQIYYTMGQTYEEAGLLKQAATAYKKSLDLLWRSLR